MLSHRLSRLAALIRASSSNCFRSTLHLQPFFNSSPAQREHLHLCSPKQKVSLLQRLQTRNKPRLRRTRSLRAKSPIPLPRRFSPFFLLSFNSSVKDPKYIDHLNDLWLERESAKKDLQLKSEDNLLTDSKFGLPEIKPLIPRVQYSNVQSLQKYTTTALTLKN